MFNQEKLKMWNFPLKVSVQKAVQNFIAKIVQSACFFYRLSKELYNEIQGLEVGLNKDLVWFGIKDKEFRQFA